MQFTHVLAGIAVVLVVEGLLYAIAPTTMRRLVAALAAQPEAKLRNGGLGAAVIGMAIAWLLTR